MVETRRYPIVKRVNLEGLGEQWGSDCYAYVVPTDYELVKRTNTEAKNMTTDKQADFQLEVVRSHFVSGKINIFNGTEFVLSDMTSEDATGSVLVADALYSEIMGFKLDPKAFREEALKSASLPDEPNSTETT